MPHRPRSHNLYPEEWTDYIEKHNLRDQLRERNWSKNQRKHIKQVYFAAHPEELRKKRRARRQRRKLEKVQVQFGGLKTESERRRFIKRHPEQFAASQF